MRELLSFPEFPAEKTPDSMFLFGWWQASGDVFRHVLGPLGCDSWRWRIRMLNLRKRHHLPVKAPPRDAKTDHFNPFHWFWGNCAAWQCDSMTIWYNMNVLMWWFGFGWFGFEFVAVTHGLAHQANFDKRNLAPPCDFILCQVWFVAGIPIFTLRSSLRTFWGKFPGKFSTCRCRWMTQSLHDAGEFFHPVPSLAETTTELKPHSWA